MSDMADDDEMELVRLVGMVAAKKVLDNPDVVLRALGGYLIKRWPNGDVVIGVNVAERDGVKLTPPDHAPTEQDVIDGRPYIDGNAYWPECAVAPVSPVLPESTG